MLPDEAGGLIGSVSFFPTLCFYFKISFNNNVQMLLTIVKFRNKKKKHVMPVILEWWTTPNTRIPKSHGHH